MGIKRIKTKEQLREAVDENGDLIVDGDLKLYGHVFSEDVRNLEVTGRIITNHLVYVSGHIKEGDRIIGGYCNGNADVMQRSWR